MAVSEADIDQFKERITGRRVNEDTAGKYTRWVQRFEMWRPAGEPDLDTLLDFDSVLADPGWTDYPWENVTGRHAPDEYAYRTRTVAISAAKLWCRLHHRQQIVEEVQHIVSGEADPFDPPYISEDDVEDAIRSARDDCDCAGCEAALRISYDAILRGAEMTRIRREDLDRSAGTLRVRSVKGSMNTGVSLAPETVEALDRHITEEQPPNLVFTNTYGNGWKSSSWCTHFRRNHHEAGSHSFGRHSPIVHRLQRGESFGDVYRRARHQHPAMTARYARLVGIDIPDWANE